MILEIIEPYIEVVNLVLAMIIVIMGIFDSAKLQGKLKSVWTYFLVAILLFGIHEIFGSLAEFGIFEIDGLYAFTEFLFIVAFLICAITFRKLLGSLTDKNLVSKKEVKK